MAIGFDFVIIGGGIAGISLAARVAERGHRVAILEMEEYAPWHATARSAALKDPIYVPNADVAALAMASAEMFERVPGALQAKGSLHLFGANDLRSYTDTLARCHAVGAVVEVLETDEVGERFPFLRLSEEHCIAALYAPPGSASSIDVGHLYEHFRRGFMSRGGNFLLNETLLSAAWQGGGWTIDTGERVVRADVIINAAGAWADIVAARCGIPPLGLVPLKRTVLETSIEPHALAPRPDGPFVFWDGVEEDLYCDFKTGGRVLLSPADETHSQPCDAAADEFDLGLAIHRFSERTHLTIRKARGHHRAGLRTFAADRRPVIGWAGEARGFFWSAGYGGFGIECSLAASALASDAMLGEDRFSALAKLYAIRAERFAPERLRRVAAGRD